MRIIVGVAVFVGVLFGVLGDDAWSQLRPTPVRPYIDSTNGMWHTGLTTGYGKLSQGKGPTGWLLCREGDALVGVSFKRGTLIDRVQIHCAPVASAGTGSDPVFGFVNFRWDRSRMTPPDFGNTREQYPAATAGGNGGQRIAKFICPDHYLISGMAANVNLANQIDDLVFECAKALGNAELVPTTAGTTWFTQRCQPTLAFAVFPVDGCLSDLARNQINRQRFGSRGGDYRAWMENRGGVIFTHKAGEDQKCAQYGAVGLAFAEEPYAPGGLPLPFTLVVTSLRLICIAHPPGWWRPRLPGQR